MIEDLIEKTKLETILKSKVNLKQFSNNLIFLDVENTDFDINFVANESSLQKSTLLLNNTQDGFLKHGSDYDMQFSEFQQIIDKKVSNF